MKKPECIFLSLSILLLLLIVVLSLFSPDSSIAINNNSSPITLSYVNVLENNAQTNPEQTNYIKSRTEFDGKVEVSYLYANWCNYCKNTTPIIDKLNKDFSSYAKFNYLEDTQRQHDVHVAQIYSGYKTRKLFGGFPSLVIKGKDGEISVAGQRNYSVYKNYICSAFQNPPKLCD